MHSISRLSFILVACFLIGLVSSENASAQRQNQEPEMTTLVKPTSAEARRAAFAQRQRLFENSLLSAVPVDNIGPTIMSGRVVDIDARPSDPSHFVVAYASGGLWITRNNGQSFDPLFDHEGVMTIGDVAVDWETGTIWVSPNGELRAVDWMTGETPVLVGWQTPSCPESTACSGLVARETLRLCRGH